MHRRSRWVYGRVQKTASFLLCRFIRRSYHSQSVRLFFTGRPHVGESVPSNMQLHLGVPISITLKADAHNIRAYILHQLDLDDYKDDCMNEELREEILEKIIDASDEMLASSSPNWFAHLLLIIACRFFLPALQIQTLLEQPTLSAR